MVLFRDFFEQLDENYKWVFYQRVMKKKNFEVINT